MYTFYNQLFQQSKTFFSDNAFVRTCLGIYSLKFTQALGESQIFHFFFFFFTFLNTSLLTFCILLFHFLLCVYFFPYFSLFSFLSDYALLFSSHYLLIFPIFVLV